MAEPEIPFEPTEVDIVSTKLRTWNLKHAGNIFYTDLVHKLLSEVKNEEPSEYREVATKIVDILTVERNGRFLKLKDGETKSTVCTVMGHKACVSKVAHALRTAQSRQGQRAVLGPPPPPKKKKTSHPTGLGANKSRSPKGTRSRRTTTAVEDVMFVAKAGIIPVHKYILDSMSLVCNQTNPATAHEALDSPLPWYTIDSEPDDERIMRLQLRLRFASAAAVGMSPLELAQKLLKLWGGSLVEEKRKPLPPKTPAAAFISTDVSSPLEMTKTSPSDVAPQPIVPDSVFSPPAVATDTPEVAKLHQTTSSDPPTPTKAKASSMTSSQSHPSGVKREDQIPSDQAPDHIPFQEAPLLATPSSTSAS